MILSGLPDRRKAEVFVLLLLSLPTQASAVGYCPEPHIVRHSDRCSGPHHLEILDD